MIVLILNFDKRWKDYLGGSNCRSSTVSPQLYRLSPSDASSAKGGVDDEKQELPKICTFNNIA